MSEYRNYKKFFTKDEIDPFSDLLDKNNIPYKIIESKPSVDLTFAGNTQIEYWLQLLDDSFIKVDSMIEDQMFNEEIDSEHYLNDFTDTELIEILKKYDEWSKSDFVLSKILLKKRGVNISEDEIKEFKDKRIASLEKPEAISIIWIIAGYILAIFGGIISIIIGISIATTKKTIPDGRKVFNYDKKSRLHARNILFLGFVILILFFIFRTSIM